MPGRSTARDTATNKRRVGLPVPPRRRVKCYSTSETGIVTLSKQRRSTDNGMPSDYHSGAPVPDPGMRADAHDVTVLQAQLAAMGIELSLDAVRERVRLAEERLTSQDGPKGVFPLQFPMHMQQTEDISERPRTARHRGDEADVQDIHQVKRPSTARARLEHDLPARPALSPVWAEGDDSSYELVDDQEDISESVPDKASIQNDNIKSEQSQEPNAAAGLAAASLSDVPPGDASSEDFGPESIPQVPSTGAACNTNASVGILTQKQWKHGSIWEWGKPTLNVGGGDWGKEGAWHLLPGESTSRTSPLVSSTASTVSRPSRIVARPLTARPNTRRNPKSSSVALSPRTNLRQSMGMWAAPNTPGPGAYNMPERIRKGATFSKDRKLAPTSTERFLESTPSPAAYRIQRPRDFGRKSLHAVQTWGVGPQFPPSREYVETTKVPGPKYDIVTPFDLGRVKGFSFGTGPQAPLTPREIEAIKVPGPGRYNSVTPLNSHAKTPHLGSGTLTPRADMLYIDPRTPGPGAYDIDRALTPRHVAHARSANISRPDSDTVVEMKERLAQMKESPSVFDYETMTGVEIGADNAARHSAPYFSKSSGRDLPATGDPIRELRNVPSSQHYDPRMAGESDVRGHKFGRASRNSIVTGL